MTNAKKRRWKRWAVAGLAFAPAICLVGAIAAEDMLLRWGINRFVLAESGLQIRDAAALSIDPFSLIDGPLRFAATDVRLQHAALPSPILLGSIAGTAGLGADGTLAARLGIGRYTGVLTLNRRHGATAHAKLRIGPVDGSALLVDVDAGAAQASAKPPSLRVMARRSAPIWATLFETPAEAMTSLPDHIDILLSPKEADRVAVRYRLIGPRLDVDGAGEANLATATITHRGAVRWQRSVTPETEKENALGAAQRQIDMLATQANDLLQRFHIRSDVALVIVDPAGKADHYGISLVGHRPSARSRQLGRLTVTSSGADQQSTPLVDLAINRSGQADRPMALALDGLIALAGAQRPLHIGLLRPAADSPVDQVKLRIGPADRRAQPLMLDFSFTEPAIGSTMLTLDASGRVAGLDDRPAPGLPLVADAVTILKVLDAGPARAALRMDGQVVWRDDRIELRDFKLSGAHSSILLDGKLDAHDGGALSVEAAVDRIDLSARAQRDRLAAAIGRLAETFAAPKQPNPKIDLKGRVEMLRLPGQQLSAVDIDYQANDKLGIGFKRLAAGGQFALQNGHVDVPLRGGATATGEAATPWGALRLAYRPVRSGSLTALLEGGALTLSLPGIEAKAAVPPLKIARELPIQVAIDQPAKAPALAALLGERIAYWPDEPVSGTVRLALTPDVGLRTLSLTSPSAQVTAVPLAGGAYQVRLSGAASTLLRGLPQLEPAKLKNRMIEASFRWRSDGARHAFEQLRTAIVGLRLEGAMTLAAASALQGRLLVRADKARDAAGLFPAMLGMLPAPVLDYPLEMPVEIGSSPHGMTIRTSATRLGPLLISTDVGMAGDPAAKRMAGNFSIAGPLTATLLDDLPPWLQDLLGPRQTLSARLALDPRGAVEASAIRLSSDRVQAEGQVRLPLQAGRFDWSSAKGQIAGDIQAFQWRSIRLPKSRYAIRLGDAAAASEPISASLSFPAVYGGSVDARLSLAGQSKLEGRVELVMRNIDLSAACRDAGFRLFGAGRLDGALKGAVPVATLTEAEAGSTLMDNLLRQTTGAGRLQIRNGVMNDIDFDKRTASTADASGGVGEGNQTPFRELSGNLLLKNGLLQIEGGRFQTPAYTLNVSGTTTLPKFALDFLIKGQVALVSRALTGKTLISAPILPLAVRGTLDRPSYEFLPGQMPGTKTATKAIVDGLQTVEKVDASLERTQKKVDKFFSDRFFRPLLGKKKAAGDAAAEAAPAAGSAPPQTVGRALCEA